MARYYFLLNFSLTFFYFVFILLHEKEDEGGKGGGERDESIVSVDSVAARV